MKDNILIRLSKDHTFTSVLDLGAGQGNEALFFANTGAHVVAVDTKPASLQCSTKANIAWIQSMIHEYQIPENHFDLIVLKNVIHFLKPRFVTEVLGKRIVRGLTAGGILYLQTFEAHDIIFEKNKSGFYSKDEFQQIFSLLDFQDATTTVIQDDHPPYGEHEHTLVRYVFKKKQ